MRKVAFLVLLVGAISLATAGIGLAYHGDNDSEVAPTVVSHDGSGPGGGQWDCEGGLKFDPPSAGDYALPLFLNGHWVTINLTISYSGGKLGFNSTSGEWVTSVLVKGGPNANLYDYSGLVPTFHDDGLVPPTNPNNNRPYGFSHVCFFFDKN